MSDRPAAAAPTLDRWAMSLFDEEPALLRLAARVTGATGLDRGERAKDLADVVELIRRVPLDASFAARLPSAQRVAFRKLCRAVRGARRRST